MGEMLLGGVAIGRSKVLLSLLYISYWAIFVETNDPNSVIHNRVADLASSPKSSTSIFLFGNGILHNLKHLRQVGRIPRNRITPLVHNIVPLHDKGSSQLQDAFGDTLHFYTLFNR